MQCLKSSNRKKCWNVISKNNLQLQNKSFFFKLLTLKETGIYVLSFKK